MYEHQTSYVSYCRLSEEFSALMCVPKFGELALSRYWRNLNLAI